MDPTVVSKGSLPLVNLLAKIRKLSRDPPHRCRRQLADPCKVVNPVSDVLLYGEDRGLSRALERLAHLQDIARKDMRMTSQQGDVQPDLQCSY